MLLRMDATAEGKVVTLTEMINENIPHEKIRVVHDHTFNWLDDYVYEWYSAHYTRPAKVVREYGERIAAIIDFTYVEREKREKAKRYAEELLSKFIERRTPLDDNLQRIESELSLTCDPKRINELLDTKKELQKARLREISREMNGVEIMNGAQRNQSAAA